MSDDRVEEIIENFNIQVGCQSWNIMQQKSEVWLASVSAGHRHFAAQELSSALDVQVQQHDAPMKTGRLTELELSFP